MSLKQIHIEGFKSIRELTLDLAPLNVLIGANGAGKSNFIGVFRLLNEILEERLQVYSGSAGAESFFHFGSKNTPTVSLKLIFDTEYDNVFNGYEAILHRTAQDSLIFIHEEVYIHDKNKYLNPLYEQLGDGHKETMLYETSRSNQRYVIADFVIRALRSWKIYHFHDTSAEAGIKKSQQLNDNERLRADASNLAAFLYRLQETEPDHYRRIIETIRLVAPFFDDFNLRPSPLNPNNIRLEWQERGSDAYFDANALSDGTLRFMCLVTLLLQPDDLLPSVILIDEPELGLHPYAITLLASLLKQAADKTQVIVSTQSVPLINQFAPEDVIVVDRKDGQSEFHRLNEDDLKDWLGEYGLGDLWEKNVIGGRPQRWERSA